MATTVSKQVPFVVRSKRCRFHPTSWRCSHYCLTGRLLNSGTSGAPDLRAYLQLPSGGATPTGAALRCPGGPSDRRGHHRQRRCEAGVVPLQARAHAGVTTRGMQMTQPSSAPSTPRWGDAASRGKGATANWRGQAGGRGAHLVFGCAAAVRQHVQ
jgi:hypothetical protein